MDFLASKYFTLSNFSALVLSASVFLMFVAPLYAPITLAGWVLVSLINIVVKRSKPKFEPELVLLFFFYVLHLLGFFWTNDIANGYFDLEVKMSLAIVPLIIFFQRYNLFQLKLILYVFIVALVCALFYAFFKAGINYSKTVDLSEFFYTNLSTYIHPSYFAFYLNLAGIVLFIDYALGNLKMFSAKSKHFHLVLILLFCTCNIFLLSKIGILTSFILIIILLVFWIRQKKIIRVFGLVISGLVLTVLIFNKSEYVKTRTNEMIDGLVEGYDDNYVYSTGLRLEVWKAGWNKFVKKPVIGYGTGDVDLVLQQAYLQQNVRRAGDLNLNSHNQYLQTGLALGLVGVVMLLSILILPIIRARRNFYFGLGLSCSAMIFFFTESVLETQAGVLGFAIFYSLLNTINLGSGDTSTAANNNHYDK